MRGQYEGYRSIDGVAPDSTTETFAALRLDIQNWRWSGVPFFIRAGKRLPVTQTELRLVFKRPPRLGSAAFDEVEPNQLVVRLDPSTGIRLELEAHRADGPGTIELDMEFAAEGGEGPTPYEVLLHAALVGDSLRFTHQDGVEETWRVMQPLLDAPPPVHPYAPGSWGPEAADQLLAGLGRWHEPWIATSTLGGHRPPSPKLRTPAPRRRPPPPLSSRWSLSWRWSPPPHALAAAVGHRRSGSTPETGERRRQAAAGPRRCDPGGRHRSRPGASSSTTARLAGSVITS